MWNVINQEIEKNSENKNNINYILENNKKISDSKEIAEHFNKYFCNIGKKLSDKTRPQVNEEIKLPSMNSKCIFFQSTNQNEIKNIINFMENENGGNNNINAKTLKTLVELLVDHLTHTFNLCIDKAIWPDALKSVDVIPLHISKEKHIANNYRPISLMSNITKVIEKIIHKRIITFINKCDILAKNQYGFMKNKSIKDALTLISNVIYGKLDKSIPIAILFLDIEKTFDTVNYRILLHKLYNYGVRGSAHNLIKSYLGNRLQEVKLNNETSHLESVNVGVPQETILGPLLFLLYINDLLLDIPEDEIVSYADEKAVVTSVKTWKEVEIKMNVTLYKISTWLALKGMS